MEPYNSIAAFECYKTIHERWYRWNVPQTFTSCFAESRKNIEFHSRFLWMSYFSKSKIVDDHLTHITISIKKTGSEASDWRELGQSNCVERHIGQRLLITLLGIRNTNRGSRLRIGQASQANVLPQPIWDVVACYFIKGWMWTFTL